MNLPYIAIEGVGETPEQVLDSLIAIEPLLVMMGYNVPDENWNNKVFKRKFTLTHIICGEGNKTLEYHSHWGNCTLRFKANEMDKLIKYLKLW